MRHTNAGWKLGQRNDYAIKDRVVQQALKNVLEPIFEKIFLPQSHGYRPDTDAHAAVRKAEAYIKSGYNWLVDADIEEFFDHVDHKILMDLVCEQVSDGRILFKPFSDP